MVAATVKPERLIFVDECGTPTSLAPLYGYAPRGERLYLSCPEAGGRTLRCFRARGCELLYLPPYSPDFNPIEEALPKVKRILRKIESRTREALVEAIGCSDLGRHG
jgi:DDE superfamily endonuclease